MNNTVSESCISNDPGLDDLGSGSGSGSRPSQGHLLIEHSDI
jgi:hypothetical protein